LRKLLTFVSIVSIIGGCLEIDKRGTLPAPASWNGKIPPTQVKALEVLDEETLIESETMSVGPNTAIFECTGY